MCMFIYLYIYTYIYIYIYQLCDTNDPDVVDGIHSSAPLLPGLVSHDHFRGNWSGFFWVFSDKFTQCSICCGKINMHSCAYVICTYTYIYVYI